MRLKAFSLRNTLELLRDPLSLIFGIGLPVVLLILISVINNSISEQITIEIFKIENFAPGIAVFSFSFLSMFSAVLISKDRTTSFLTRLFSSPLKSYEYILGYSLPLLAMAFFQGIVCFGVAIFFGLEISLNLVWAILLLMVSAPLFIGFGIFFGSLLSDKQVGGISSILVQITALGSGMWFPLEQVGGIFAFICNVFPFVHSLNLVKSAFSGDFSNAAFDLIWIICWSIAVFALASAIFAKKMKN